MENLKIIFQEATSSSSLNINEEVSAKQVLQCIQNYLKRASKSSSYPLPSLEGVLETFAYIGGLQSLFEKKTILLAEDVIPLVSEKISYKELCQVTRYSISV